MPKNFYKVLGLRPAASELEIRRAYLRLALRYHPDGNQDCHPRRFAQLAEAFEVLSDRRKRSRYDALGEEGLRRAGHQFHGDPHATYARFVRSRGVSIESSASYESSESTVQVPTDDFASVSGRSRLPKNRTIEHVLLITLEDIAMGAILSLKILQRRMSASGLMTRQVKKLNVDIRPGWKAGTRITFPDEGDEEPDRRPGDVVFVLREKPHPIFRRQGCDLRYTARITLKQALSGAHLQVPTLLGEPLLLCTKGEVITPESTRRFPDQGLPHEVNSSRRGDLVVAFSIEFPKKVSQTLISSL
ncbi:dnaJ protein homolog 1 [Drosophila biarmipes]|uniref:dnaJ protein homolog 1 n=1 Tax=Drosophila biarmipes TaxID=125945 RepID=UPI0007E7CB4F|nr:dnaJ protein homolog 1 [Drosophila biarmipes]